MLLAESKDLLLRLSPEHGVLRLAGDELLARGSKGRADLIRIPFAEADVSSFSLPHHLGECLHRFFERSVGIESVALVEIDVIGSKALERAVYLFANLLRGEPGVRVAHREIELGSQHVGGAIDVSQQFSEKCLCGTPTINVGGVEEVDSQLQRLADASLRLVAFHSACVGQPRAEADLRNA